MRVTIIGTGYVGLVAGLGFAKWGNDVVCLDVVEDKIKKLQNGICPIYEPGAITQLQEGLASGRLHFTSDKGEAIRHGTLIFIAVGTPEQEDGSADLRYVERAADDIAEHMASSKIVVDKSTVPVGTARALRERIRARLDILGKTELKISVASNPEFLREGKAIGDFNNPDRIVLGVADEIAREKLMQLYNTFVRANKPIIVTTPETAEMIKYASNAFLATKITFINEIANLCEAVGADALQVAAAMGKDGRISPKFLHPGPGYGGSCFPKDTKALADTGVRYGAPQTVVESVIRANERQKAHAAQKVLNRFPQGGTLAVLGLSFKPETDDIRESPAMEIVRFLMEQGRFTLRLYDPKAMENARQALGAEHPALTWCSSAMMAIEGADAILLPTEWAEFNALDFDELEQHVRSKVFFDFRNVYRRPQVEAAGFEYHGTGVG
jgi:UDPglucose 6-dehydrogenase